MQGLLSRQPLFGSNKRFSDLFLQRLILSFSTGGCRCRDDGSAGVVGRASLENSG